MSPLIPTPMNPRLYFSISSTQRIAKWFPDAHVSFSLVWVTILKSIFLFKHSSQISLTLYELTAFMKAVDTFTKCGQHHWIIREKSYKRLANNNNLAFKTDTMPLIRTYWQFYFIGYKWIIFLSQVLIILPCWFDKIFQFSGGSTAKIIMSARAITLNECKYMFMVIL